jgi:hypothetical protein
VALIETVKKSAVWMQVTDLFGSVDIATTPTFARILLSVELSICYTGWLK